MEVSYTKNKGKSKFRIKVSSKINGLFGEPTSIATLNNLLCSNCSSDTQVEMHHIRMMRDVKKNKDSFSKLMIKVNRKQIPLCRKCHMKAHHNS